MLDNGYIYPATARLSLYLGSGDWGLTVEVFGYSPRAADPSITVYTYSNDIVSHRSEADFVSVEAYETYIAAHPFDAIEDFFPIDPSNQYDERDWEFLNSNCTSISLRGEPIATPSQAILKKSGILPSEPGRIRVFEICRYLAVVRRNSVLATQEEKRLHLKAHLREVLVLDDWQHPDLVRGELPSETVTFRQIAKIIETKTVTQFPQHGNTHWSNWPEAGTL